MARAKAIEVKQIMQWQVPVNGGVFTIWSDGSDVAISGGSVGTTPVYLPAKGVHAIAEAMLAAAKFCTVPKRVRKSRAKAKPEQAMNFSLPTLPDEGMN